MLRLSTRQTFRRFFDFFGAFHQVARSAKSWDELVLLAYQTWLTHSYPAGRALAQEAPSLEQIEQAGLVLKALVSSELKRLDLPEQVRQPHQDVLKIDPLDLGYAVRDLILEHWGYDSRAGDSGGAQATRGV